MEVEVGVELRVEGERREEEGEEEGNRYKGSEAPRDGESSLVARSCAFTLLMVAV